MAISPEGTDTTGSSATKPLTFNHTKVSSSDTLIIVHFSAFLENNPATWSPTYGGNPPTGIVVINHSSSFSVIAGVAYWFEAEQPSDGVNQVSISSSASDSAITEYEGWCSQYSGVSQTLTGSDTNTTSSGTAITNTVSAGSGDLIVRSVAGNALSTYTHDVSQTELYDRQGQYPALTHAGTTLTAGGTVTTMTSTIGSSIYKHAAVAAHFSASAGGTATSIVPVRRNRTARNTLLRMAPANISQQQLQLLAGRELARAVRLHPHALIQGASFNAARIAA